MSWSSLDIPSQEGRIAIVTGANSGIGFETAKVLAARKAKVILACRNLDKGKAALEKITDDVPDADLELAALDISSLDSVRNFTTQFLASHKQLDLLINNAGIMTTPEGQTEEGFELQFGTNHLGHFALTGLLLDCIEATPKSRIVSLSSQAHRIGKLDFDNLNAEKGYNKVTAYALSKLACLVFAYELQRRLEKKNSQTISTAAHPGSTKTDLTRHNFLLNMVFLLGLAQSSKDGALPTLRAATDLAAKGGDYYGPSGFLNMVGSPELEKSTKRSYNEVDAARLWNISEELTGIHYLSD